MNFTSNHTNYVSVQSIWNLSWLLEPFACCKIASLSFNFVTAKSKHHPKTTGHLLWLCHWHIFLSALLSKWWSLFKRTSCQTNANRYNSLNELFRFFCKLTSFTKATLISRRCFWCCHQSSFSEKNGKLGVFFSQKHLSNHFKTDCFPAKMCLENSYEICHFLLIIFALKMSANFP